MFSVYVNVKMQRERERELQLHEMGLGSCGYQKGLNINGIFPDVESHLNALSVLTPRPHSLLLFLLFLVFIFFFSYSLSQFSTHTHTNILCGVGFSVGRLAGWLGFWGVSHFWYLQRPSPFILFVTALLYLFVFMFSSINLSTFKVSNPHMKLCVSHWSFTLFHFEDSHK